MSGAEDQDFRQGWEELLLDGEILDSFSNDHDTEINVEEINNSIDVSKMQRMIKDKYNKVTSIYLDEDGWCTRYAYLMEDGGIPSSDEHDGVKHIQDQKTMQRRQPVVDTSMMSRWRELDELTRDKLYIILYAANSVWKRIHFNIDLERWVHRTSGPRAHEVHSSLAGYGMSCENERSMLNILKNGRSKEVMKKNLQDLKKSLICNQRLEDVWVLALTAGMRHGSGRSAAYMLLDMIASLLSGFERTYPEIAVTRVTNLSADDRDDACYVSSFTCSKTRSISPSPVAKRRRVDDDSDSDSDIPEMSPRQNRITWPKRSHQSDLRVISFDASSGVIKFLLAVEVLYRGKTLLQAQQKLTKDLVHVLQSQNMVYGLLFSETSVLLYRATRDRITKKVQISYETYTLLEGPPKQYDQNDHEFFRVAQFQRLIMDTFTCILHGLQCIDA